MSSDLRTCYRCEAVKPSEDFSIDRLKASGRASICRACDREKAREYYLRARVAAPKPDSYACEGCGETIQQTAGPGRLKRFCSPTCRSRDRYYKRIHTQCVKCGAELLRTGKPLCKPCQQAKSRADRKHVRAKRYGLTWGQIETVLLGQQYACPICLTPINIETAVIDHDHRCCGGDAKAKNGLCGECNRGLLCTSCNKGIGLLGDNVANLIRAITYLQHPEPYPWPHE